MRSVIITTTDIMMRADNVPSTAPITTPLLSAVEAK